MFILTGKYVKAHVMIDYIDNTTREQIKERH